MGTLRMGWWVGSQSKCHMLCGVVDVESWDDSSLPVPEPWMLIKKA